MAVEAAVVAGPEVLAFGGPCAPGGACVGQVVAAGDAATDRLGKRVVVGPTIPCGECDVCRRGRVAVCPTRVRLGADRDGALAGEVVASARWSLVLDGPLDGVAPGPPAAALGREAPLAYEMVARAGVAPGETTVWLGDGAVARFGVDIAKAKGAAAFTLTAEEQALPPADLAPALATRLAAAQASAPWRVFETSARAAGRRRALALAGPGSTLVLCANEAVGSRDDTPLDLVAALDRDVVVAAVAGAHPDLQPEVAALVARGELDLAGAVTIAPWSELAEVIAALREGRAAGLTVVARG